MRRSTLVQSAVAMVILASAMIGFRERGLVHVAASANPVWLAAAPDMTLAPAVVLARRPTLSEILDIVLEERPTAAALAPGRQVTGTKANGFPEGSDEAHVAAVLRRHTGDAILVNRIATSIVKEGRRRNIGSSLLVGVLLTENPWLDPRATSSVGARGLMQVMPLHAGKWGCPSPDLFDVEANICHGVAVLSDNLSHSRTLPQALLAYNGCVRGTNTPDCFRYPRRVYGNAKQSAGAASRFFAP
ncbi:MAG: transglycosylase SLT domain-containing protein [Gemmatimonadaceae bacterium]